MSLQLGKLAVDELLRCAAGSSRLTGIRRFSLLFDHTEEKSFRSPPFHSKKRKDKVIFKMPAGRESVIIIPYARKE